MAALANTLLSIKEGVYTRANGQYWVTAQVGDTLLLEAINRAVRAILIRIGRAAYMGTLLNSYSWTATGTQCRFPLVGSDGAKGEAAEGADVDSLLEVGLEVLSGTAHVKTSEVTAEKIIDLPKSAATFKNAVNWTRAGNEVWVRPCPPASSIVTVHYVTAPDALAADGDVLPFDESLIPAMSAYAARVCLSKVPSTTPDRLQALDAEVDKEVAVLLGGFDAAAAREYAGRTSGGTPPGQGGT